MQLHPPSPLAYLNGRFLPAGEAHVAVDDAGFVHGATVAERLRTFGGRLFRLEEHLARLTRSLNIVGLPAEPIVAELRAAALHVAEQNSALLPSGQELSLAMFVTPGSLGWQSAAAPGGPTVCVHAHRLPVERWAGWYRRGTALANVSTVQPPPESWPAELKCRSRMHYYLADRQAAAAHRGAMALLCDSAGHVTEASMANVAASLDGRRLVSPPPQRILPGVTLAATRELAQRLSIEWQERDLTVAELAAAQEIWLTSTPWCVAPVTQLNGAPVGAGAPGPLYRRILAAWNELAGYDLVVRAEDVARAT